MGQKKITRSHVIAIDGLCLAGSTQTEKIRMLNETRLYRARIKTLKEISKFKLAISLSFLFRGKITDHG